MNITTRSKPRAKRSHEEHDEQVKLIAWARMQSGTLAPARKMFAIANGGSRNVVEAVNLKAEGVTRGIPDLFMPYPSNGYHGLFIEMKTKKGVVSTEQADRLRQLQEDGYAAHVCRSFESAVEVIREYLGVSE